LITSDRKEICNVTKDFHSSSSEHYFHQRILKRIKQHNHVRDHVTLK